MIRFFTFLLDRYGAKKQMMNMLIDLADHYEKNAKRTERKSRIQNDDFDSGVYFGQAILNQKMADDLRLIVDTCKNM